MAPSKELTALLFELERAESPLERLQIIARAWRSVRALDTYERHDLARRVGFDGAEEIVERLASKGGIAPATLLEALRRARRADAGQLRSIVAGLRKPGGRGQAALEGLQLAQNILAPENDETDSDSPEGGTTKPELPASAAPDASEVRSENTPGSATSQTPAAAERPTTPTPAPPPARPPHPPIPRPPEARPRPVSLASRVPRPAPPPTPRPVRAKAAPPPSPAPPAAEPAELAVPPETRVTALRALRRLEARLEAPQEPDAGELEALVLGLPDGWVRRRAVLALLRHGTPHRIPDALRLVDGLGLQRDRRWVLAALLEERTLTAGELEQALALITSEPARRRLRRLASLA